VAALIFILINSVEGFCFPLNPHQHLLFVFLMIAILTGMRWNFTIVVICISLQVKDVEHSIVYLLVTCTSFENCLFNSFAHLLIGLFAFLVFNFLSCSYTLDINLLSDE
jgi:hypothetical protein